MVDIMSGEIQDTVSPKKKNPKTKGRAGGLKGGKARAAVVPNPAVRRLPKKPPRLAGSAPPRTGTNNLFCSNECSLRCLKLFQDCLQ